MNGSFPLRYYWPDVCCEVISVRGLVLKIFDQCLLWNSNQYELMLLLF